LAVLPKAFLVEDMGREMGLIQAALADVRKRLAVTQRQIETQKRATEALRKRLDRQRDRMAHQLKDLASR
jgi:capsule polysaccharide export protein KpsE/RkpR